jgi:hypothetical protein
MKDITCDKRNDERIYMRKNGRNQEARAGRQMLKQRRTFTLSRDSISLLNDLCASREGPRRRSVSAVLDDLLRALDKQRKQCAVERAIANFYDGSSTSDRTEESLWGDFSLSQFTDGTA